MRRLLISLVLVIGVGSVLAQSGTLEIAVDLPLR
jgi:hypothetical protein